MASSYNISSGTGRVELGQDDSSTFYAIQVTSTSALDNTVTVKLQQSSDDNTYIDLANTSTTIAAGENTVLLETSDFTLNTIYLHVDVGSATAGVLNLFASSKKKDSGSEVSITGTSDVNVTNSPLSVQEQNPLLNTSNFGSFGELISAHKTPLVQIANKYQIDPSNLDDLEIFEATGGSADNSGNLFRCQSGTSVGGYGVLRSTETLNYRAGQGVEGLITASFTTGVANSLQFGGMFNISDTVAFGYDGADFSVIHSYGGVAEVQCITITATGAGTCTVTLDGTASSGITVTNSTVQTNAEEIRAGLAADALANSWRFEQVDDKVFCIAKNVGNKTNTMSISGGVTASISECTAGVSQTNGHVAQSSWNVTTSPFAGFDPTQLNVYKIQFGYLGVANINYFIYNPNTGKFVLVHQIEWANANNTTHISTPNFKIGWTSASLGSSGTNLTVLGASGAIFLEGDEVIKNNTFADSNIVSSVGTTNTAIITIRNRIVYGDRFNLGKVFPISVSVDNDHTKGLIVDLYRNTTLGGTTNYQYEDEYNSLVIVDKVGTTLTGGTLIESFTVEKGSDTVIDLTNLRTELLPESIFTIAARTISGTGAVVTASLTWKEEK